MKMAGELAIIYGENKEDAEFAGLIHDIAKEIPMEEAFEYIKNRKIEIDEIETNQTGILHAKIGANIAKEEFNVNDKIYKAIKYHTTGNVSMDTFAKIIYVADKIEENRTYEGVEQRRELAKRDLDRVIIDIINDTTQKSIEKEKLIHPASIDLRNKLLLYIEE